MVRQTQHFTYVCVYTCTVGSAQFSECVVCCPSAMASIN